MSLVSRPCANNPALDTDLDGAGEQEDLRYGIFGWPAPAAADPGCSNGTGVGAGTLHADKEEEGLGVAGHHASRRRHPHHPHRQPPSRCPPIQPPPPSPPPPFHPSPPPQAKAKTATKPNAAAAAAVSPKPKAKVKAAALAVVPKPRARPPKAAKTSAKASPAKANK
ncbi:vegetative cell wall protein gp1-like [Setaria italica]|uniref:vegetative cell wall protein gp1-like n=1 Tax=Setaria italica TaxID=4555 RepID=UPI0007199FBB|nr:vegetative cell wall protein gp1-like [Setaria italica]